MRREVSSKDFAGDEGLGTPMKLGGSFSLAKREASGDLARPASNLTGGSVMVGVFGRSSSLTIDWRFLSRSSSSSSSVISTKRLRRIELVEEDVEPEAAWSEQAADSLVSLSSFASAMEKVVSKGEKRSQTALKWTATRAAGRPHQLLCAARGQGGKEAREWSK
jgi:hypothetical protein